MRSDLFRKVKVVIISHVTFLVGDQLPKVGVTYIHLWEVRGVSLGELDALLFFNYFESGNQ